jgi:hypothetical protein
MANLIMILKFYALRFYGVNYYISHHCLLHILPLIGVNFFSLRVVSDAAAFGSTIHT